MGACLHMCPLMMRLCGPLSRVQCINAGFFLKVGWYLFRSAVNMHLLQLRSCEIFICRSDYTLICYYLRRLSLENSCKVMFMHLEALEFGNIACMHALINHAYFWTTQRNSKNDPTKGMTAYTKQYDDMGIPEEMAWHGFVKCQISSWWGEYWEQRWYVQIQ